MTWANLSSRRGMAGLLSVRPSKSNPDFCVNLRRAMTKTFNFQGAGPFYAWPISKILPENNSIAELLTLCSVCMVIA
jgi:hypothetical protein